MSSLQQRHGKHARQSGPTRRRGAPTDDQALVGNAALAGVEGEEMQGDVWGWLHDNTGWDWAQDLSTWWSGLWGSEEDIEGPTVDEDGPVVDGPAVTTTGDQDTVVPAPIEEVLAPQIDRTDSVSTGMKGAVISGGAEIQVFDGPGTDAAATGTILDGKPVEIIAAMGDRIEVEYRVPGDKEERGWVDRSLFSDQPALNKDDAHPGMMDDHIWQLYERDQVLPEAGELEGTQVKQGGLADCYFVAAMIAVGNARPAFLEESFRYNESTGLYEVRFFEEQGYDWQAGTTQYNEVWVEVDGYLPTDGDRTAYARANPELWGALMEKAYAKWQGGYDVMGNGGYGSKAMAALSGTGSDTATPSRMAPDEVLQFFQSALDDGRAIYAGTHESWESEKQTPLSGSEAGPYTGEVKQIHDWNKIKPGSLRITDTGDGGGGTARDTGSEHSKTASIVGGGVSQGEVDYAKPGSLSVTYDSGRTPNSAEDLEVAFRFKGMIAPQYQLVGWHGYAFKDIVDGKLQFHNPWGSWQPKPVSPEDFTKYFSSCATNLVPQARAAEETDG